MKLDVDVLRYLTKEDFRVLTAVEMGMRNVNVPSCFTSFSLSTVLNPCIQSFILVFAFFFSMKSYPLN